MEIRTFQTELNERKKMNDNIIQSKTQRICILRPYEKCGMMNQGGEACRRKGSGEI